MISRTQLKTLFAILFIALSSPAAIAQIEEEQQEESFSQPVQKLSESVGNVAVYSHIYGANFMTEQERCNYLLKLDGMKTKQERARFRAQHREKIDLMRKEKGG
ncbi:MAG: hypothetical protein ACU841_05175 [Gammaproteobacteria bacterium]